MHISFVAKANVVQINSLIQEYWPKAHALATPLDITYPDNSGRRRELGLMSWNLSQTCGTAILTLHAEEPALSIHANGSATATFRKLTLRHIASGQCAEVNLTLGQLLDRSRLNVCLRRLSNAVQRQPIPA